MEKPSFIPIAKVSVTAEEVETLFGPAIDLARALGMRPLLAHCHTAKARLYDHLGRGDRASAESGLADTIRDEIGARRPLSRT